MTTELKQALLYQDAGVFVLVDPSGKAVQMGSEQRCVAEYINRRWPGAIILDDKQTASARRQLEKAGWRIVAGRMGIFTKDVGDLKKLLQGA